LYPGLLEGAWTEHRWRCVPAYATGDPTLPAGPITEVAHVEPLSFRSAAATDVGRARDNNEDGFLDRPEAGLWVVADGMGGHSHGEVASRMVCDALADFQLDGTFEEAVEGASRRVQQVNDHLLRAAGGPHASDRSGSTVVVLLLRGARSAVLWAGDSRVYRWRAGRLEQLSHDHSLAAIGGPAAAESTVITRAVGVQPDLTLDVHRDAVRPDDRFLLCSDGLTRVIPDAQICALLETPDLRAAVDGLIKATLDAGAPDNVTVVIAEAYR
jgi:serine/threonine protein phosphatase PrpC